MGLETTQEVRFPVPTRHPHANFLLFYSSLWFKRNGAHQEKVMKTVGKARPWGLGDHICIHTHEDKRKNRTWQKAINPQNKPTSVTYFFHQVPKPSQTVLLTEDRVLNT